MAKRRLAKRSKSKGFDPLASPYKSQAGFNRAVNLEAGQGYRPQLQDIQAQGSAENRKHGTRGGEIESLYNSYGNELQRAFDQTTGALNNLVSQSQGASAADQAALRAALGASQGQQSDLAQRVGAQPSGVPSTAGSSATLLPAWGTAEANRTALGSSVANAVAEAAQRRSLPALGKIRSSEEEARRHFGEQDRLSQARKQVLTQVPALRLAARKSLLGDAREGQNLAFQQRLAGSQFGLDVQKQGLAERQFKHQSVMDQNQLQLQRDQLQAQVDNAASTEDAAAADSRSKAFDAGQKYIDSLFADRPKQPGASGKGQQNRWKQQAAAWDQSHNQGMTLPSQAYRRLRTQFGLSDHDATVLVNLVALPNFRAWAKRHRHGPDVVQPNKGKGNPKPKKRISKLRP